MINKIQENQSDLFVHGAERTYQFDFLSDLNGACERELKALGQNILEEIFIVNIVFN